MSFFCEQFVCVETLVLYFLEGGEDFWFLRAKFANPDALLVVLFYEVQQLSLKVKNGGTHADCFLVQVPVVPIRHLDVALGANIGISMTFFTQA